MGQRAAIMSAVTTEAKYLDGVRSLLPGIRARAESVEQLGRIPEETVRELDEAGVFRGLQPRQWGGLELHPRTFFESVVMLASACAATGWVAGVVAVHPWEMGLLCDESQREFWGANPRVRLSSSYAPTGRVRAVDDGFVLSGQWRFSSGVDLSDWAILGGIPEGAGEGDLAAYAVSRNDFTVDPDSWNVAGLKGTGSKTINVAEAFVPARRSHRVADVSRGNIPGFEVNDRPLYHMPWMAGIFTSAIAAPAIGAAVGALECYVEQTRTRVSAYGGPPVALNPGVQLRLADALAEVDAARRGMAATWDTFMGLAESGVPIIPANLQAKSRYDGARALSICLRSVIEVFEVAGGSVMHMSNPIQRFLRDLLAMRNHPMGALESSAITYARSVLELPKGDAR
jgi:3-hydroxy-9,10-secoandrosta-1,3,5(10)-triene-9,17-dione monooxygenase